MNSELVLVDREALLAELQRAFDAQTADVLLRVLDKVAAQVREAGVTSENFGELKQIVAELAEGQRGSEVRLGRVEATMERLAEAQTRTEGAIRDLVAAQTHTEERLTRLEIVIEETNAAVGKLASAIDQLRKQVGGLSETVGGDIEDIAYIVLYDVLKRELGWQVGVLAREWQTWDGEPEEVNVFGQASDPARPGQVIWVVGEAKHNLTAKEVDRFARQVERARRHLAGEVFPVCFCYRARPEVQQQVRQAGIRLVFSYGKLV